jgi:hypothetical protein
MNKLFTLLFIFFSVTCFHVNAQVNLFEKGYIVQNGDTISGYIKNAPDLDLTQSIEFKENLAAPTTTTFTPQQITSFTFESTGIIHAAVIADIIKDATTHKVERFAKLLLSGYTSLYKLELPTNELSIEIQKQNTFVYVLKKDGAYHTLGVYETYNNGTIRTNNRYRVILRAIFVDCETYEDNLDRLPFDDESIIEEVKKYNTCKAPASISNIYTIKPKPLIKHGFEGSYAKGSISKKKDYAGEGYALGYFWDVMHTDKSRHVSGKLGIGFMLYDYEDINYRDEPITESVIYLRFPVALQYNIIKDLKSDFIPFINFGATAQVSDELQIMQSVNIGMFYDRLRLSVGIENTRFTKGMTLFNFGVGIRLDDALRIPL